MLRDLGISKRSSETIAIILWFEYPWAMEDLRGSGTLVIRGLMFFALTCDDEKAAFHYEYVGLW